MPGHTERLLSVRRLEGKECTGWLPFPLLLFNSRATLEGPCGGAEWSGAGAERTWNAMLHAVGRGGDFFLLTPPPFRFVIQPPSDDPIDNGVLPGRAGLLGEYLYF